MTYLDRMRLYDKSLGREHKCHYCKCFLISYKAEMSPEEMARCATKDHILPKALGGMNEDNNYVVACAACNRLKGHIPYKVFKVFADMVLIPYPDLPLHILRNSLNLYIMHLLERSCTNEQIMRTACTATMLRLKEGIDEYEGNRVKASKKRQRA